MSTATSLFLVLALVSVGAQGCAADAADIPAPPPAGAPAAAAPADVPGSGEATSSDEIASMKYYDCHGGDPSESMSSLEVGLSSTKMIITDLSKHAAPPDSGKIDHTYSPTAQYTGAVRYQGWSKIVESFSGGEVGEVSFLVSPAIQAHGATGKIWMRTSGGSGGSTTQFSCKSKTATIKVDTAKKARFACDVLKMICTNDNPPGQTCLNDVFVTETAGDQATAKLTYYDHFGVHVDVRTTSLAASPIHRTTMKVDSDWTGNTLQLDYRGGITYTGTFKVAGGGSSAVQCNDLAMLD